jgi:hypothetical protein
MVLTGADDRGQVSSVSADVSVSCASAALFVVARAVATGLDAGGSIGVRAVVVTGAGGGVEASTGVTAAVVPATAPAGAS